MESEVLLDKILKAFREKKIAQVEGYTSFGYIRETSKAVLVTRVKGKDTRVPFLKILNGIDAYKADPGLYNEGPGKLHSIITRVNSPVWSLMHLLSIDEYKS